MPAFNASFKSWAEYLVSLGYEYHAKFGLENARAILEILPNPVSSVAFDLKTIPKPVALVVTDNPGVHPTKTGKASFENPDSPTVEMAVKEPASRKSLAVIHSLHAVPGGIGEKPTMLAIAGSAKESKLVVVPDYVIEDSVKVSTWEAEKIFEYHLNNGDPFPPSKVTEGYLKKFPMSNKTKIGAALVLPPLLAGDIMSLTDSSIGANNLEVIFLIILEWMDKLRQEENVRFQENPEASPKPLSADSFMTQLSHALTWTWWMMVHNQVQAAISRVDASQDDDEEIAESDDFFSTGLLSKLGISQNHLPAIKFCDFLQTSKASHLKAFRQDMDDLHRVVRIDDSADPVTPAPNQDGQTLNTPRSPATTMPQGTTTNPGTSAQDQGSTQVHTSTPSHNPPRNSRSAPPTQHGSDVGAALHSISHALTDHLKDQLLILEEAAKKHGPDSDDPKKDPVTIEAKSTIKTLMTTDGLSSAIELTPTMERLLGAKVESAKLILTQVLAAKGYLDVQFSSHTAANLSRGVFTYQLPTFPSGLSIFCFSRTTPTELLEMDEYDQENMMRRLKNEEGQGLNERDIKKILNNHKTLVPNNYHELVEQFELFQAVVACLLGQESLLTRTLAETTPTLQSLRYHLERYQALRGPVIFAQVAHLIDAYVQQLFRSAKYNQNPQACNISNCLNWGADLQRLQFRDFLASEVLPQSISSKVLKYSSPTRDGAKKTSNSSSNHGGDDSKRQKVQNPNVVSDWKLRPGEPFSEVFIKLPKEKGIPFPQLLDIQGKKVPVCRSWHIEGSCKES